MSFFLSMVLLASLVFMSTMSSCSGPYSDVLRQTSKNERLWDSRKISNYQYVISEKSVMTGVPEEPVAPILVEVRNGVGQATTYADVDFKIADPGRYREFDNMDKLFVLIRTVVKSKPDNITASFDPSLGFPMEIIIERLGGQGRVTQRYIIQNFKVVE